MSSVVASTVVLVCQFLFKKSVKTINVKPKCFCFFCNALLDETYNSDEYKTEVSNLRPEVGQHNVNRREENPRPNLVHPKQ